MAFVQSQTSTSAPVAPPTPQEISRKLSVHNRPVKSPPSSANQPVSGTESDSDSFLSPDQSPLTGAHFPTSFGLAHAHPPSQTHTHGHGGGLTASTSIMPLSSIAERRGASGDDETDEDDDGDGDGDEDWVQEPEQIRGTLKKRQDGDSVIKTGYLWKKGERRKTWKKRWFVLRPAQLAFYGSSAEYQLLRLLDLSDIHSCTPVTLKRHAHSFVLISPTRTYYLQAPSEKEMEDWVQRLNETREALMSTTTQNSVSTPPIPIPTTPGTSRHPNALSITPMSAGSGGMTPSPPSARSLGFTGPVTSESDSEDAQAGAHPASVGSVSYSPAAATIVPSSSKSQAAGLLNKDPSKTVLSAYLMKCRSKRRGWRKRWFVLTGEKLMYSASHMDTKRQRSIELSQILDALEYDLSHEKHHPGASSASSPSGALASSTSPRHGHGDDYLHSHSEGHEGIGGSSAQYTFKIVTTKRALLLCAPSEEEEIKWLSAVRALIARRSNPPGAIGGTGTNPSSAGHSGPAPGGAPGTDAGTTGAGIKASPSVVSRRRSASGTSAVARDEHQHP